MINGRGVRICYECIDLCREIVDEERADKAAGAPAPEPASYGPDSIVDTLSYEDLDTMRERWGAATTVADDARDAMLIMIGEVERLRRERDRRRADT